jgi:hypothetical protein
MSYLISFDFSWRRMDRSLKNYGRQRRAGIERVRRSSIEEAINELVGGCLTSHLLHAATMRVESCGARAWLDEG